MNNIDHAAHIIDTWIQDHTLTPDTGNPKDLARALADAGLLLPDLPPVTRPKPLSEEWYEFVEEWGTEPMWETPERHGFSAAHEYGRTGIHIIRDGGTITDIDILAPEEAEALGLALLAAAQHAKEHHAS